MKKHKSILSEALKDEKNAPKMYNNLLKKLKTSHEKKVIRSIISDERKHFKLLNKLKGGVK